MSIESTPFLRNTLLADAGMGAAAAVPTILAADFMARLLELPEALVFWAGVALLPIAALLLAMARKDVVPTAWLSEIILINGLWAVASFAILFSGLVQPNLFGGGFIVAQALAVATFAALQFVALRRGRMRVA